MLFVREREGGGAKLLLYFVVNKLLLFRLFLHFWTLNMGVKLLLTCYINETFNIFLSYIVYIKILLCI